MSVRDVVRRVPGLAHGTAAGWFSGHHVPTRASTSTFATMLAELGVTDDLEPWHEAVERVRARPGPKTARRGRTRSTSRVPAPDTPPGPDADAEPTPARRPPVPSSPVEEPDTTGSPYVGLRPYTAADSAIFHGRRPEIDSALDRLTPERRTPLIVLGASGSGKSSLVMAGVAPELTRRGVRVTVVRPAEVTAELLGGPDCSPDGVIVIDQLEELWGDDTTAGRRTEVVSLLSDRAGNGCPVICTLRADFFQQALSIPELRAALDDEPLFLGPPDRTALTEIIVQPARDLGYTVEPSLVSLLLDAVSPAGDEPAARSILPLLSHVLLLCWELCRRRRITVDDYYSTGGIEGAIRASAEAVYTDLDREGRNASRSLFLRMVDLHSGQLIRRRASLAELSHPQLEVVRAYAAVGLLTVDDDTVTATHEVVLFSWPRLTAWIDADRDWLRVLTRIRAGAADWDDSGRTEAALPSASATADFQRWRSEQEGETAESPLDLVERDYLDAAAGYHHGIAERDRRRLRTVSTLAAGLAVVTVLALLASILAVEATEEARTTRDIAFSRSGAQASNSTFSQDPALGRAIALAAYRIRPTVEARSALLNTTRAATPRRYFSVPGVGRAVPLPTPGDFVIASTDGVLRFFHSRDAHPFAQLTVSRGDRAELYDVSMSETLDLLAVAGQDGVHLVDISDPGEPRALDHVADRDTPFHSIRISPDGSTVAAGTESGRVMLWPLARRDGGMDIDEGRGRAVNTRQAGDPGVVKALEWLSDSRTLLVADGTPGVKTFLDAHTSGRTRKGPVLDTGDRALPLCLRVSPDGRTIATGTTARDVRRWTVEDGKPESARALPILTGWSSFVNDVDFDTEGRLAGVSSDESAIVFDDDGDVLLELPVSQVAGSVRFFRGSDSADQLLTFAVDGVARVWDLDRLAGTDETNSIFQSASSADLTRAVLGVTAAERRYQVVDTTGPLARPTAAITPDPDTRFTGSVAMSADGDLVYAGTAEGAVQIFRAPFTPGDRSIGSVTATSGVVVSTPLAPNGKTLAVCTDSAKEIVLVDVSDPPRPRVRARLALSDPCGMAEFSADSTQLAVTTSGPTTALFDTTDPDAPVELPALETGIGASATLGYAHDRPLLAVSGGDEVVRILDVGTPVEPRELASIPAPKGEVYWLAFSSDDTQLVATSSTGQVTVYDVTDPAAPATWAVLGATSDPLLYQSRVASPTGALLAVGIEGTVTMWQLDVDRAIADACSGGVLLTADEWQYYLPDVEPRPLCD